MPMRPCDLQLGPPRRNHRKHKRASSWVLDASTSCVHAWVSHPDWFGRHPLINAFGNERPENDSYLHSRTNATASSAPQSLLLKTDAFLIDVSADSRPRFRVPSIDSI